MRKARPQRDLYSLATNLGGQDLQRLVTGLNRLAERQLIAQARGEPRQRHALSAVELTASGLRWEDCRELASIGLLAPLRIGRSPTLGRRSQLTLTRAGFALLQKAIPAGALRPVYDVLSRRLCVAGEIVLQLAVQARNQAAILTALEFSGWKSRVPEPLRQRSCSNAAHHLAATTHNLNRRQDLIEFHADDGSARWNWRPMLPDGKPLRSAARLKRVVEP
ncbi:MAG TPA: hypothetical protein VG826_30890 [Pirellulales bacterium]|nr:hypothetical protein [Pirellulales bacterium]